MLFRDIPEQLPEELIEALAEKKDVRIERIVSRGHHSPEDFWYDVGQAEWVVVVQGEGCLAFPDGREDVTLTAGDYIFLAAHEKHRVKSTAKDIDTIWIAVYLPLEIPRGRGYHQSVIEAELQLNRLKCPNLGAWISRSQMLRETILKGAGLWPLENQRKLPLLPASRGRNGLEEDFVLRTLPGTMLSCTLYRPDRSEIVSGILVPHGRLSYSLFSSSLLTSAIYLKGHFPGGRFSNNHVKMCRRLASRGALVLSYSMVGYPEGDEDNAEVDEEGIPRNHLQPLAFRHQLWNSIRCIDFLESLGASNIGAVGASGGGTQSFMLAAVDERIRFCVPIVMVSSFFAGGCVCESGMPIYAEDSNNAEIAALIAPRPMLLVSCGSDWTRETPNLEFPFLKHVYQLYDAADEVENVHLPDGQHDCGDDKVDALLNFVERQINYQC